MVKLRLKRILCSIFLLVAASQHVHSAEPEEVVTNYANIAYAVYEDSLITARALEQAIDELVNMPSEEKLHAARKAWMAARVPYQQSEVYRFGNALVDEWEGKVNAWPLDEGLIDYVTGYYGNESDANDLYTLNVIANPTLSVNGRIVNASEITPTLLAEELHEAGGIEANVATGYHAIEFLLWGQDLNGSGPGAGARPATDFDMEQCTGGNCKRRVMYLQAASELLISDLEDIVEAWAPDGEARKAIIGSPTEGLRVMLTGMGSLSYGELAGERMKLGLLLHDPEEEHDCFSDNTHNSHYYNQVGIINVYRGEYGRVNGEAMSGPSISELVAVKDKILDEELLGKLANTYAAMRAIRIRAEGGEAYDQMIAEGNYTGNSVIQTAIDRLIDQTKSIERVVSALGLSLIAFEGSDSLDNTDAVFQ